jgi:hypothetical protein
LAPILHLPELLSLIFCHVQRAIVTAKCAGSLDEDVRYSFQFEWRCEVKGWMTISHVCHVWREVAINTASLWSTLVMTKSIYRWPEECLRRSKQSALVLFADFHQGNEQHSSVALLRELRNHVGRCRVLCLRLTTKDLTDLLSQTDTPHLVHFHYSHLSDSESPANPSSPPPLIGDSTLRADSLRRLLISNCPVDWSASIFHRLTYLQLHSIPDESRLECDAFLSFLLGMPNLEFLDLCDFLQEGNSDANYPVGGKADGKHLKNLKHVELGDNPTKIAFLLSSLVIPPFCRVFINAEGYPSEGTAEEFLPVFSWAYYHFRPPISESSQASHHNYWRTLRIFHLGFLFGFQGYTIEEDLEPNSVLFEHCIELPPDADHNDHIDILPRPLFTLLPISHIVYLEIACGCSESVLSKSMWIEIFGPISTLASICIESDSLPFFEALSHDPGDPKFIPFPILASVIVRRDEELDYDSILGSLCWRFQLGVPLKGLTMEDCGTVPSFVLEQLQKLVGQVTVTI